LIEVWEEHRMKKLLCIVLALGILPALAACGREGVPVAAPEIETTAEEAVVAVEDIETTTESETAAGEENAAEEAAAPEKPVTVAEIVAFYNEAANRVKTEKPGYSFTEQPNINYINGGAQWLVNIINSAVQREAPQAETVAKGANHNNFAVPGKDWASKLDPIAVQSAACTEKGDAYEIRINMKREAQPGLPKNVEEHQHGRAFKAYSHGMILGYLEGYEYLGRIEKFAPAYHSSYILCNIDKAGHMKSAQYYLTFDAEIEGRLVSAIPVRGSTSITMTGQYVF